MWAHRRIAVGWDHTGLVGMDLVGIRQHHHRFDTVAVDTVAVDTVAVAAAAVAAVVAAVVIAVVVAGAVVVAVVVAAEGEGVAPLVPPQGI